MHLIQAGTVMALAIKLVSLLLYSLLMIWVAVAIVSIAAMIVGLALERGRPLPSTDTSDPAPRTA